MQGRDLRLFAFVAVAVVFVVVESLSFKSDYVTDWPYVAIYLVAAGYAGWHRAWFAATVAVSVAVVRGMVALEITGRPFEIASVLFASLFLLLIAVYVRQRDALEKLTGKRLDR